MEDFLSIENYQLITNYLIKFSQKKFNLQINVNDYDEKIYSLMEQIYNKFNPNLSKTKANMFVIKNILDTIKEDVFKLNFRTEKQITMNEMIQNENKQSEKIKKNVIRQIPVSISDDINQKISRQLETRQIYDHIRVKNDIDPVKMYKKLNIEKQKFNQPIDLSAPKQYKTDILIKKPEHFDKLHEKIYGEDKTLDNFLTIDSRDRNTDIFSNSNNYTVNFNEIYTNVVSVELITAEIPKSGYFLENYNNILHFQEKNNQVTSSTYYEAEIPIGNYTSQTIGNAIQNALNMSGQSTYSVSYTSNEKIKIQSDLSGGDNIFNLVFSNGVENYGIDSFRNKYITYTAGRSLGFDAVNLSGQNNYTSNNRITFQSEDYVLLEIPELSGLIDGVHYNSQDDFAKILLDSAQNKTTFYKNLLVYPIIKTFLPTIDLSKLTINFKIFGNNFYDFHGLEHSLTFKIQTLKQKIYSDIDIGNHADRDQNAMIQHLEQNKGLSKETIIV
jgi:hypothetical protein